jgi:poly-gamma-glutamate synthesis protein (capsule biosynthesis protein)
MLIAGDLASPNKETSILFAEAIDKNLDVFRDKTLICNLEGLLYEGEKTGGENPVLFNHPSVIDLLNEKLHPVFCLSNNHTSDIESQYEFTSAYLNSKNIPFTGAGKNARDASRPLIFFDSGRKIILFNACWDFLLYKTTNPKNGLHIHEIDESSLIAEVKETAKTERDAIILVYLHWNLDYETLPFPMHRQFSMELIESGANLVAGTHSHCVQGGEKYKNGFIIYGLGNFFIPHKIFINGRLIYPAGSNLELVADWDHESGIMICHWLEYSYDDGRHSLKYFGSENFEQSYILKEHSPFVGLTSAEYMEYFRRNRKKKILIPVYSDFREKTLNRYKTLFLKNRARIAHSMAKLRLKNW